MGAARLPSHFESLEDDLIGEILAIADGKPLESEENQQIEERKRVVDPVFFEVGGLP